MAPVSPEKLKKVLDALPETPGVYFMKDAKGRTLYIGKAKNLKNRVCTYFHDSYGDPRIRTMVSKVEDIEVLQAPSEVDALLMEARLIKDIQPRYNDRLKDDKSFTMLAITQFDDFPKVWVVAETDEVNAETYGPSPAPASCGTPSACSRRSSSSRPAPSRCGESDPKRRGTSGPACFTRSAAAPRPAPTASRKERYLADVEMLRKFLEGRPGGGRGPAAARG